MRSREHVSSTASPGPLDTRLTKPPPRLVGPPRAAEESRRLFPDNAVSSGPRHVCDAGRSELDACHVAGDEGGILGSPKASGNTKGD